MCQKNHINNSSPKVILWGVCDYAIDFKRALDRSGFEVVVCVDLYKSGQTVEGVQVISPENFRQALKNYQGIPVIITARSIHDEDRFSQVENYIKNYMKLDVDTLHPKQMWTLMRGTFNRGLFNISRTLRKMLFEVRTKPVRFLCSAAAKIIPVKKNQVVVVGRHWGQFLDNGKHFFLYLSENRESLGINVSFLTERKDVFEQLTENRLPVLFFPSFKAVWFLLRSKVVITDDRMWIEKFKLDMLSEALKVQLWHGVPLKKLDYIAGQFRHYSILLSTSRFFTETVYSKVFQAEKIIEAGYPRNDCFFDKGQDIPNSLTDLGSDEMSLKKIREHKKQGKNAILYAPTYRMAGLDASPVLEHLIAAVEEIAEEHNIIFVLKLHPGVHIHQDISNSDSIIRFESGADISPLLKETDILITDYSSVYFDFLLLERPVLFFPYDLDLYAEKDLGLSFDYCSMTPGPLCATVGELLEKLVHTIENGADEYKEARHKICSLAFDQKDGLSSKRIWQVISDEISRRKK